jgi:acyl-CoA thioester hydrolase
MEAESKKMFFSQVKVYYEDTDSGGVVYYANYLKFAERARTDALGEIGINQGELKEKQGVFFVVKKCAVDFVHPASLDQILTIKTLFSGVLHTSLRAYQEISRDGELICIIDSVIVCVSHNGDRKLIPRKIPLDIKKLIVG